MKATLLSNNSFAWGALLAVIAYPIEVLAHSPEPCEQKVSAAITVDQGHPWRPPFGLERVGALPVALVELTAEQAPTDFELVAYRDGHELERHPLSFLRNPSLYGGHGFTPTAAPSPPFFAHAPLSSIPTDVALQVRCEGRAQELARQPVTWPEIEAQAIARSDRRINPVDLGAVLPPQDWLLLARGQRTALDVAVISHMRDLPNARLRAWFEHGRTTEIASPLVQRERVRHNLQLPFSARGDRTLLHLQLMDGPRELWKNDIQVMVADEVQPPAFGAVETKLRYDPPIAAVDPTSGARLPPVDYSTAWDPKFKDVVVYLPNGSRFVFWRGSNYIPFWAGKYNTGALYQWVEDCRRGGMVSHSDGSKDCPEPLFDRELRYSRVRIMESSPSRVHVRWDYQLTDVTYEVRRGGAAEDFYFYPDGFGTRVVTAPSEPGAVSYLSEFIVMTPAGAYPLEVLPRNLIEALPLEGGKERTELPVQLDAKTAVDGSAWPPRRLFETRKKPMVYRLYSHKDDPAATIYFHPSDPAVPYAYAPFFDQAELVTPAYWGNHWPLNRGKWTGWSINDEITTSPGHSSIALWRPREETGTRKVDWEVEPLMNGKMLMPDIQGHVREMNLPRFAWLIAHADLADETLREWGISFATPPSLEVTGGRLDIPSYSPERRALRLVAESPSIKIVLKPVERTINPVFEIDGAPKKIESVTLDEQALPVESYTWDGAVLWIEATIGTEGKTIDVQFH